MKPMAIVPALALAIASCSGGGGTAGIIEPGGQVGVICKAMLATSKLQACGGQALDGVVPANTLPLLDGVNAKLFPTWSKRVEAMALATDCGAVLKAFNDGAPMAACTEAGKVACNGSVLESCTSIGGKPLLVRRDCGAAGMECNPNRCTFGDCTKHQCGGDDYHQCWGQHVLPFLCSAVGMTCGKGTYYKEWCIGKGDSCKEGDDKPKCEGTVARACISGKWAEIDCAAISGGRRTCDAQWIASNPYSYGQSLLTYYLPFVCGPAGKECKEGETTCDGSRIAFCIDGFRESFECRSYGFDGCKEVLNHAVCTGFGG